MLNLTEKNKQQYVNCGLVCIGCLTVIDGGKGGKKRLCDECVLTNKRRGATKLP
jgi:hypothetical protein